MRDHFLETIVNNESSEIIRIFYSAFDTLLPPSARESTKGPHALLPPHLLREIDEMNEWIYTDLNNGVYRAGFATSQSSYDSAVNSVFSALDRIEAHLTSTESKYLFGDHLTDADIRLYPTVVRFDVAYHTIFKCNRKMVRWDYPMLHGWLRRIYWSEEGGMKRAFRDTVDFEAVSMMRERGVKGEG